MNEYAYGYSVIKSKENNTEEKNLILVFKPVETEQTLFAIFEEGLSQPDFNMQVATFNSHKIKRVDPEKLAPEIVWEKLY